jgi:hypothetical protein
VGWCRPCLSRLALAHAILARMPESELMYLCGGEIDAGEFSLDITSADLHPPEITTLLGLQPTYEHLRGDALGTRGHTFKSGRWKYSTGRLDFRTGRCFQEQFDDFVRALPDEMVVWERIATQHEIGVNIYLWMRTWNREFDLSTYAMGELTRRRLSLHIDTSLDADNEVQQSD